MVIFECISFKLSIFANRSCALYLVILKRIYRAISLSRRREWPALLSRFEENRAGRRSWFLQQSSRILQMENRVYSLNILIFEPTRPRVVVQYMRVKISFLGGSVMGMFKILRIVLGESEQRPHLSNCQVYYTNDITSYDTWKRSPVARLPRSASFHDW